MSDTNPTRPRSLAEACSKLGLDLGAFGDATSYYVHGDPSAGFEAEAVMYRFWPKTVRFHARAKTLAGVAQALLRNLDGQRQRIEKLQAENDAEAARCRAACRTGEAGIANGPAPPHDVGQPEN